MPFLRYRASAAKAAPAPLHVTPLDIPRERRFLAQFFPMEMEAATL